MADGGLRVGSVFATFAVNTAAWVKGLDAALKSSEDFLKKVEGIGSKLGGMGALIAGGLGLSVAALKESSPEAAAAFEAVTESAKGLAGELVAAALPAIKGVSEAVVKVTESIRAMDPELKGQIALVTVWTAGLLLAAGALAKVAGTTAAVTAGVRLVKSTLVGLQLSIAPILAVTAALAAIAVTAAVVYEAWEDTSTGFQEAMRGMLETVKGWVAAAGKLFGRGVSFIGGLFDTLAETVTDILAEVIRGIATALGTIAEALPDSLVPKQLEDVLVTLSNYTGKQMRSDLGAAGRGLLSGLKAGAEGFADAIMTSVEFAGRGFERLGKRFKGALEGATGGAGAVGAGGGDSAIPESLRDWGKKTAESAKATGNATRTMGDLTVALKDITKARAAPGRSTTFDAAGGILAGAASFGPAGALVSAGAEGAAAGGPIGAIAAVAAELLTQSQAFSDAMTMVTAFLGNIANILGDGLAPALNTLGPIFQMVETIVGAVLTPILAAVAQTLEGLSPVFEVLNILFQGLAPVISMLVTVFNPVTNSLKMLQPALKGLFEVVKFISGIIMEVSKFMAGIFNGLISAVQSVLRDIAKLDILGAKPLAFLGKWADGLESSKVKVDEMTAAQAKLTDLTYDSAKAEAAKISATYKARDAVKSFGDSLTNVPSGFKFALAAFGAMDSVTMPMGGAGAAAALSAAVPSAPPPAVDNSVTTNNLELNFGGAVVDPEAVAEAVMEIMEGDNIRDTGSAFGGIERKWLALE